MRKHITFHAEKFKSDNRKNRDFDAEKAEYSLKAYKKQALKIAKEFKYDKLVQNAIVDARSEAEVSRIMRDARHEKFDKKKG